MSELQLAPATLEIADEEQMETELAIRNFCINSLAMSVPKFMDRDRAADLIVEWFPADQLALAALYRQIAQAKPLKVA